MDKEATKGENMFKHSFVYITLLGFLASGSALSGTSITIHSREIPRVLSLFKEIAHLSAPAGGTAGATECGYIFPGDGNKFGCKGSGRAAADVAAACSGGGQLACAGSGSGRTCTCAFD